MRTDFTPDNVDVWVDSWKRGDIIEGVARAWLNSFDFEHINIIVNHSSVTLDNFSDDIKPRIKIWNNAMRHDTSVGPSNKNYNQAYVHTFLSGKRYCMVSHDNIFVAPGWVDLIKNTNYDLYLAPQGDQVHLMTREGLNFFGWWDERYATQGHNELDFIVRALRKDIGVNRASLVDYHGWHGWPLADTFDGTDIKCPVVTTGHPEYGNGFPYLRWNDIGLAEYWTRADKIKIPATGMGKQNENKILYARGQAWNNKKWRNAPPYSYENFVKGPTVDEVDWYPWAELHVPQAILQY
jgi:hypothetical protein